MEQTENLSKLAINSCISTLQSLGVELEEKDSVDLPSNSVHIQIEFIGEIKGYIILETSPDMACKLANILLAGMMTVSEVDDMTKSVLAEICNMVSGNLATMIANLGFKSDIKPPALTVVDKPLPANKGSSLHYISSDGDVINTYFLRVA